MNASSVPLTDVLPWTSTIGRTILICDSVETDGRFVLHTVATEILNASTTTTTKRSGGSSMAFQKVTKDTTTTTTTTTTTGAASSKTSSSSSSSSQRILWLACGPVTDRQIAMGLKKCGCDVVATYLQKPSPAFETKNNNNKSDSNASSSSSSPLVIRSLAVEMAERIASLDVNEPWDPELYLKGLYKEIKDWILEQQQQQQLDKKKKEKKLPPPPCWIVLDDVSMLASMVGDERSVFCFVHTLSGLATKLGETVVGIFIRCSHDFDQQRITFEADKSEATEIATGWIGGGGQAIYYQQQELFRDYIPWERHLTEIVDGIVDVVPLSSGYSRDAHGRLMFTTFAGKRGWGGTAMKQEHSIIATLAVNYCLGDNGVRAIRLKGQASSM